MKTKHHCVQCGKELVELVEIGSATKREFSNQDEISNLNTIEGKCFETIFVRGCQNPACPNYGLLAMSIEEMPKEK